MKHAVIVHCWGGTPDYVWYPRAKADLEAIGFEVQVPAMPETDSPQLFSWLAKLQTTVTSINKDLYLIGHSTGCATVLRYLELLPKGAKIGGVVLVGGFSKPIGYEQLANFFETPIDLAIVKTKADHFAVIQSDNDPYVAMEQAETLRDGLGATLIIKHGMGHFAGKAEGEVDCLNLPDVIEAIKAMRPFDETNQ